VSLVAGWSRICVAIVEPLLLFLQVTKAQCQTFSASDTAALTLRLETNRPSYHAGDSIKLRLIVRNALPDRIEVPYPILMDLISLHVFDAGGHQVPQGAVAHPIFISGPVRWYMGPWDSVAVKGPKGQAWIDLRDWGYQIEAPGRYTIVGVPPFAREARPRADTALYPKVTLIVQPRGSTTWW
jgi:hypothetical protein